MNSLSCHPCRVCGEKQVVAELGRHYREAHNIKVHGAERRLPARYVVALCDGHVKAMNIIALERKYWDL